MIRSLRKKDKSVESNINVIVRTCPSRDYKSSNYSAVAVRKGEPY